MSDPTTKMALVPRAADALTILDEANEAHALQVLEASLYPGAKQDSIRMVLGYCRFNNLDPLKKPVHIVPMKVKTMVPNQSYKEGTNSPKFVEQYVERDVIMPSVGLYRTEAARAGDYMGMGEPEYGPTIEGKWGEVTVRYPEWCKVTVKKWIRNQIVEFVAKEFWLENYATAGSNRADPNAMWKKRPFGQLGKCTEAQALRKAWPDTVGSAPTAEEMEGKSIDEEQLSAIDASRAATLIDKTRQRTETLRHEMTTQPTAPTAVDEHAIDVGHDGETVDEEWLTRVCDDWTKDPKSKFCLSCGYDRDDHIKREEWKKKHAAATSPTGAESPTTVEPTLAPDGPLVLDGITFPAQLKAAGVKDRIRLPVYEQLQTEAKRLGFDLRTETEKLLGVVPDDLSNEAAKIFVQYLQARKA